MLSFVGIVQLDKFLFNLGFFLDESLALVRGWKAFLKFRNLFYRVFSAVRQFSVYVIKRHFFSALEYCPGVALYEATTQTVLVPIQFKVSGLLYSAFHKTFDKQFPKFV